MEKRSMRGRIIGVAGVLLLAAAAAVAWWTVKHVPEGQLAVARTATATRTLPPGFHVINPLREKLIRIPRGSFPVAGIAALQSRDGAEMRLPFSAEISLSARSFEQVLGALGEEDPIAGVTAALEGAVGAWAAGRDLRSLLEPQPAPGVEPVLQEACAALGIRLQSLTLQKPDPDVFLFLAEDALSKGDPEGPRDLIREALEESPGDWRLITAQGLLHEAAGDWGRAEAAYREAVRRKPGAEAPLGRIFLHHQREGQLFSLEETLRAALEANPGSVRLHNWLALTYIALERYPAAFDHLEAALELDPHSEATLQNLGGLYQRLGRLDDAAETYRRGLEDNPASQVLRFNLGLAELARGDLPAARAALESAREAGPGSVRLHNVLAETYRRSGMKEEATAELLASFRLEPEQKGLRGTLTSLLGHPPEEPAPTQQTPPDGK
jgi:tetratricopeptide (TPR) repeat protein